GRFSLNYGIINNKSLIILSILCYGAVLVWYENDMKIHVYCRASKSVYFAAFTGHINFLWYRAWYSVFCNFHRIFYKRL
ncbi:MAG: hypothetical protein LBF12_02555, partial [Christensenellaceae bacterium]|nr:hypothetical protein [Christensenellaceae bacterium]